MRLLNLSVAFLLYFVVGAWLRAELGPAGSGLALTLAIGWLWVSAAVVPVLFATAALPA